MELSVSPHLLTSPCTPSSSLLLKTRVRVSQTTLIPPRLQLPLCSAHLRHILNPMEARPSTVTRASLVEDNGSPITSSTPDAGARIGEVKRVTKETNVAVRINLDGSGIADSSTGIPFLDHMLDQLASHGLFDVHARATGDIHIDDHHTNEDVALAIGTALLHGLGDRKGINRFGDFSAPLDEALIHVSLDLSGRPHLSYDLCIPTERVGTYDTQLVEHFFQSLVNTSGMTLHIRQLAGKNSHHIIEATFKAFARALRQATEYDPRRRGTVPSSKGVLSRT
ncbi:imidazoleglycerol-phosphate dehydratase, chloroplastic [Rhododendron vialii]|uniref:imidazoleglycerol-phosphate dehydratase, chloroplastic n=1 Tax=Rhododendron vialii TaxID=182163 RepID=UPI00265E24C0|nr:imidazoleglycerol-phosphate dehydratase, chloroplastic [Rhododendron vialii]XP_058193207.1 imidazoleglycerol-phosphate dehydratase, chloroplastic [Rhododendron vialii]